MEKILQGVAKYHRNVLPTMKHELVRLANKKQKPIALFITCSDSRLHPNLFTQTDPGDLFLLRNAGNIVPPYGVSNSGEAATIEYAVSVLGVKNIIICGHSRCGAMAALLNADNYKDYPAVNSWFLNAEATRRIVQHKHSQRNTAKQELNAAQENVLVQLSNLRTHPCVAARLAVGEVRLHGWLYRLETGEIFAYSTDAAEFVPLVTPNAKRTDHVLAAVAQ